MNLWQIDEAIEQALDNACDPETGEVNESAYAKVAELEMQAEEKIENTALFIKNVDAEVDALDKEIKALQKRKKVAANRRDGAKRYLSSFLDGKKYKSPKVEISFRTSQAVEVTDVSKLPEMFLRYKDPDADKVALKKALKDGALIPGAVLVNNVNMQIK